MTFSFITATTLTTYSSKTYSLSGVSNTLDAGLKNNFEDYKLDFIKFTE